MGNIVAIILGLCLPVAIVLGLMIHFIYKIVSNEISNEEHKNDMSQ